MISAKPVAHENEDSIQILSEERTVPHDDDPHRADEPSLAFIADPTAQDKETPPVIILSPTILSELQRAISYRKLPDIVSVQRGPGKDKAYNPLTVAGRNACASDILHSLQTIIKSTYKDRLGQIGSSLIDNLTIHWHESFVPYYLEFSIEDDEGNNCGHLLSVKNRRSKDPVSKSNSIS